jgi:ubiquitin-protein ligase
MYQSPRTRRLRNDLAALSELRTESSVFRFSTQGDPPHQYSILFKGKGLWRDRGKIKLLDVHRIEIKLGASYPRTMPEIRWITPIYHPNISEIGMVCLGGYGTHWVPSVQLDELCVMLWDMLRYHNYDVRSPYNRDAALWVANQTAFLFPTDARPLRDLRAARGRISPSPASAESPSASPAGKNGDHRSAARTRSESDFRTEIARVRQFIEALDQRGRRSANGRREVATIRQLIERYGRIFTGGVTPPLNQVVSNLLEVRTVPEPSAQAIAAEDSGPADPGEEHAEVVLLDPVNSVGPVPEPPSTGADEIIFID